MKKKKVTQDYSKAKEIVANLNLYGSETISVKNVGAFRKYLHDLGIREGQSYTTRFDDGNLYVVRIR